MATLKRKEILSELMKLGIDNTSELNSYLKEYKKYYRSNKTSPKWARLKNPVLAVLTLPTIKH